MRYEHMIQGTFISRPNRFIAHVAIRREAGGEEETVVCHVKNTGRCRELLLPGAAVILQFHPEAAALGRKTEYSLIGVLKERNGELLLINMDSQAPNQVAAEWLHAMEQAPALPVNGYDGEKFLPALRLANIRREVTYGQSRFDLAFDMVFDMAFDMVFDSACAQLPDPPLSSASAPARIPSSAPAFQSCTKPAFMEVKGVTLEENGIAMFPDAPTERGIKHILELAEAVKAGYEAYILFVIQMKGIREFTPNQKTHPQFGDALRLAHEAGVHILAYDCIVTADTLEIDRAVPVSLSTF